MDAALTMEIFKHLSGTPVLFADVRHYVQELDVFDLVNSGEHATYFAGRSLDPEVNLAKVELHPEGFYFPAGGASVFHIAHPGDVTLARLSREAGQYRMHIVRGEFVRLEPAKERELVAAVQPNWPHAFTRLGCAADRFLQSFPTNHIHGVYGDRARAAPRLRDAPDPPGASGSVTWSDSRPAWTSAPSRRVWCWSTWRPDGRRRRSSTLTRTAC